MRDTKLEQFDKTVMFTCYVLTYLKSAAAMKITVSMYLVYDTFCKKPSEKSLLILANKGLAMIFDDYFDSVGRYLLDT